MSKTIVENLSKFFSKLGFVYVESESTDGKLIFLGNGEKALVSILNEQNLCERNALLNAVLEAYSYTGKIHKAYLAIPKILATILDGEILRRRGLGLLVYTDKEVKEVIPARRFAIEEKISSSEINELKERILNLEETVRKLSRQIDMLTEELLSLRRSARVPVEAPKITQVGIEAEPKLPSFIKDNPWVAVLSKRGKE